MTKFGTEKKLGWTKKVLFSMKKLHEIVNACDVRNPGMNQPIPNILDSYRSIPDTINKGCIKMALLDGKLVPDNVINPAKHRFIGTFRSPTPYEGNGGLVQCNCGQILDNRDAVFRHWQQGHNDTPQYVTITPETRQS
jgi:hypothetical protein